jgi:hypothetical protein
MASQLFQTALFCILIGFFTACTHYHYAPNTMHTPYLSNKNDLIVSGGLGGGDEYNSWDLQATYSPIKHLGINVKYFNARSSNADNNTSEWGKGRMAEAGAGYYYQSGVVSSGVWASFAKGHARNHFGNEIFTRLDFSRISIQPTLTIRGRYFEGGVAARLSQLRFLNSSTIDARLGSKPEQVDELDKIMRIEKKSPIFLPEISLNFGARYEMIHFYVNLTTLNSTQAESLGFASSCLTFGAALDVHQIWQKNQE